MADGDIKIDGNLSDFTKKTKHSDVRFVVGNDEVFASRAVLCIASPVFEEMFENNPTETVELPGVEPDHFKQFLKCIYPDTLDEINEETVYWIIPFADKYKVKILRERCIRLILKIVENKYKQNAKELYRHIKLSELYDLHEIEKLCVDMASECLLSEIEDANKSYPISPETDLRIVKIGYRKLETFKQDAEFCSKHLNKDDLWRTLQELLIPGRNLESTDKRWKSYWYEYSYLKMDDRAKNYMQASRLIHIHFKGNEKLTDSMKKLSSLDQLTGDDLEIFKLLPHDLKREFEKFKHSQ